jgi:hypothetical protein
VTFKVRPSLVVTGQPGTVALRQDKRSCSPVTQIASTIRTPSVILTGVSNANVVEESRTASRVRVMPVPDSESAKRSISNATNFDDRTLVFCATSSQSVWFLYSMKRSALLGAESANANQSRARAPVPLILEPLKEGGCRNAEGAGRLPGPLSN